MRFCIYYKTLKIDWILCDFYEPETSAITNRILKKVPETKIISYGNLLCKSKKDLEKIYKILISEYWIKEQKKKTSIKVLPDFFEEFAKNFKE